MGAAKPQTRQRETRPRAEMAHNQIQFKLLGVFLQLATISDRLDSHEGLEFGGFVRIVHVAVFFLGWSDSTSFFAFGCTAVPGVRIVSFVLRSTRNSGVHHHELFGFSGGARSESKFDHFLLVAGQLSLGETNNLLPCGRDLCQAEQDCLQVADLWGGKTPGGQGWAVMIPVPVGRPHLVVEGVERLTVSLSTTVTCCLLPLQLSTSE